MNALNVLAKFALFLAAFVQMALGTELVGAPKVDTKEGAATVHWQTTVPSGTVVKFGTDPQNLLRKVTGDLGDQHNVVLDNLRPGTTYHYEVGTAKRGLGRYSFTTPGTAPAGTKAAPKEENKPLFFGFFRRENKGLSEGASANDTKTAEKATVLPKPQPQPRVQPPQAQDALTVPPTRKTWGYMASLQDHFDRHGRDFNAKTPDEYAAGAWLFLQRAINGESRTSRSNAGRKGGSPGGFGQDDSSDLLVKQDDEGVFRVWDPKTRDFAAYNRDLTTKTYFRPGSYDYFDRQPGKKVRLVRKK